MDDLDRFLERHREQLLERLNGLGATPARTLGNEARARQFVGEVIDAWSRLPRKARRSPIRPGERAFWYALYTMEDLSEIPVAGEQLDPFEGILLQELSQARQLVEARAELPGGKFASRPDGR